MKRALDVVLALAGIAVLAAPGLLVALVIVLDSRGPPLFRALRVGRGGRAFRALKFRTMTAGVAGPAITAERDARVTRVGRVLRRTRFDETPQLVNVLFGDMSLVGPRPEDPRFVDAADAAWGRVLSVRPGITGPTQLAFADEEQALVGRDDPETAYRARVLPAKLRSDVAYVEGRTFAGDVALLARTLAFALGARA